MEIPLTRRGLQVYTVFRKLDGLADSPRVSRGVAYHKSSSEASPKKRFKYICLHGTRSYTLELKPLRFTTPIPLHFFCCSTCARCLPPNPLQAAGRFGKRGPKRSDKHEGRSVGGRWLEEGGEKVRKEEGED